MTTKTTNNPYSRKASVKDIQTEIDKQELLAEENLAHAMDATSSEEHAKFVFKSELITDKIRVLRELRVDAFLRDVETRYNAKQEFLRNRKK